MNTLDQMLSPMRPVARRVSLTTLALLMGGLLVGGTDLSAQDAVVFTVGGDKAAGKAAAAGGGKWSKNPTKAFKAVAKQLAKGGAMDVVVKIAAGTYEGDLGSGAFTLPQWKNAEADLTLSGGWSEDFSARDPFGTPTRFAANKNRSAPLLKFPVSTPRNQCESKSLVLDGILLDATGSNAYDEKTNCLLKGASSTFVLIKFQYFMTDLLAIRNCVFLNSPHRAFETLIRSKSDQTEIHLENNLFFNCVIPVKVDSGRARHKPARIVIDHNSFLCNWAFNPDPDTSNPAALELCPNHGANEIVISNNLFYANFGGAILALHKLMPELTVTNNNFIGNGMLHGQSAPEAVAMIVEASGRKQPIDIDTIEDIDAVEDAEGNVSIAPGLPVALGDVQVVDASTIQPNDGWENEVRRLLGRNLQGGTVQIKDYAPKKAFDPKRLPLPTNEAAKPYGFSPERVK